MNKYTLAFWWTKQPKWLRNLVYDLTGWQVQTMKIRRNESAGLFGYSVETTRRYWTRSRKAQP